MKLKLVAIKDAGDLAKERVVLKAATALELGEHLLMQTGFNGENLTNDVHSTFWFPDKEIKSGDFVVLYTKSGKPSEKEFKDVQSHFFYWGKSAPIWQSKDRSAVLLSAPNWISLRAE